MDPRDVKRLCFCEEAGWCGGGSMWAGCLLLIYYFFVSLEALKYRLSSNEAHEPLWIPALG